MGRGGVQHQMREIKEKLAQLEKAYSCQLEIYRQIREVGSEEKSLIEQGKLDGLLETLQKKQALLQDATSYESQLENLQGLLACRFQMQEFSLARLKEALPSRGPKDWASLEKTISALILVLEELEAREKQNEAFLARHLSGLRGLAKGHFRASRAAKAYGVEDT